MYEHRSHRPLPSRLFMIRLLRHGGVLLVLAPVMHRVLHKFHWDDER